MTAMSSRQKLLQTVRRPIPLSGESYVEIAEPHSGGMMVELRPRIPAVDVVGWARANLTTLDELLGRHGVLLFRGFAGLGAETLGKFVEAVSSGPMEYVERSSPRRTISRNIYTSTEYPADQPIAFHNENSYQRALPRKVFFLCLRPAATGGATLVADCAKVLDALDAPIVDHFRRAGWSYVRNFGGAYGLRWQTVFQTSDRTQVERLCEKNGIRHEWIGDRLRLQAKRPAILRHPVSGKELWCNHLTFFHVSTLPPAIRDVLTSQLREEELPSNSYDGNGAPIEGSVLNRIRGAYEQEMLHLDWQAGDLALIDNVRVAHARASFTGERLVLFAMSEPFQYDAQH